MKNATKKSVARASSRARKTAIRVGKVAKTAGTEAVKAGTKAALAVGAAEAVKEWDATKPAKKRGRAILAGLAGAAALTAAGVAISRRARSSAR